MTEKMEPKTDTIPEEINEEQPDNPCANMVSMTEWLEGETEEDCRSCLLPPVIQWYAEALKENGLDELALEIEEVIKDSEPVVITKKLDEIMEKAPDDIKGRLMDFNCAAQTYEEPDGE